MEEQLRLESSEQIRIRRKRLERNENRIAELKRLFIRIYEDNACGRLSDERFDMLSLTYETEQKQLETECVTLRQEIEVFSVIFLGVLILEIFHLAALRIAGRFRRSGLGNLQLDTLGKAYCDVGNGFSSFSAYCGWLS